VQEYALFIAHPTHYAAVTLPIRTVFKPQCRHYSLESIYDEAHKPLLLSPPFFICLTEPADSPAQAVRATYKLTYR